jgi:Phorbol esters/diacylglycerol binding domain (C1 domain)
MPDPSLPWWQPKPQRHLSQPLKNPYPDAGHNFTVKLFDCQTQCALCATSSCAFSLAAQCTTCKILCHTRCLEDRQFVWIPSCLNTPPPSKKGQLMSEKSKSHQWFPFLNLSANWCSHCGLPLSLGQGNQEGANRQCVECAKTCHAQCQLLVPSRCGSSSTLPFWPIHPICQFPVPLRATESKRPMPAHDTSTRTKLRRKHMIFNPAPKY